ncbi:Nephrocystin-3 [Actinoplanes sp. SE50]|uniref:FxSxx-COOH system tetratricopeptide repeat protein n=1 Tax=unclassified Actinoplanes TaxID=2626549 RepID=UPI00023EBEA7|nr:MULTISPECIES: FxSxx-COOH system tetratricopeptide repeat protein [unclassified Actinoplanes]AEV82393.1 Nephrocystin-3 [Actinoplanes sp. SE50/110]ATO80790.1 Nephrocystin-3 [Actinoplanes sp. SE50]SLL98198.1 Nephrocystin-3 [Actinoplanes sp. SE50/110]
MEFSGRHGQIITFYSFKGGVGRTMSLANVAWILASTGRRVLTVDWDLESPGLHRYYSPFLPDRDLRQSPGVIDAVVRFEERAGEAQANGEELGPGEIRRLARIQEYATSLERYEFPRGGSIDFVPSGRQTPEYSHVVSNFDWETFYTRLNGERFLFDLADDMRANYDVVLIDSRTGLSDNAGICTVTLPDTVVNCFAYNNQSIEGAVAVANTIRRLRPDDIRIFPVPSRVEDGEAAKLNRRRALAQQQFREFVAALGHADPGKYWGQVEQPYKPFYAYEETLATFGDRPYQENDLLAAYERLAGELVGERCKLDEISEAIRLGWLAEFEQRGTINPGPALICYTPRDRIWAEWIAYQLRLAGQRSVLQDVNAAVDATEVLARSDCAIVLLSQESVRVPQLETWWRLTVRRDIPGHGRFLVPVRVDGFRPPEPFADREPVDMFNVPERAARDSLLARLDLRDTGSGHIGGLAGGPTPRFPFEPARVWRAPARNPGFTGRDATLEALREQLNASNAQTGPVVLQGIGGVGKTQIAVEYVHRFNADYDIVWWISADQPALVVTALADLARELGLPIAGSGRADEEVAAVLEALRVGNPSANWIVIFDNTEDPEQIRRFLPTGSGDVVVTTPGQEWSRTAWTLDINVFDRSESRALLTRRVAGLSDAQADEIAAKLGDLPLAVEQAATWLATTGMSAERYLALLDEQLPRILNEPPPPGYRHPAAETWRLSQGRLQQANPAAAFLVELLAVMAPEPIPTTLLDSPGMADALARYDPIFRDQLMRNSLVREVSRFGLARVDSAVHALRMHRLVQSVIISDLAVEEQRRRREQIHVILAKAQRGEPDDQASWPTYQGILTHLEPSGALDSDDAEVHQLAVDMVRYLRYRGDLAGGRRLAERAIGIWQDRLGADHLSLLRMRSELGNILEAHGEYRAALDIQQDTADRMIAQRGHTYPHALIALSGVAAAYVGLGQYQQAVDLAEQVLLHWQTTVGDSHRRTVIARNNYAFFLMLAGDFARSREISEQAVVASEDVLGPSARWTLLIRRNLGRCLRADGDLGRSENVLRETLAGCQNALDEADEYTLLTRKELAVTLRRLGHLAEARELAERAVAGFGATVGAEHPHTLACRLEVANIRAAQSEHAEARAEAAEVLAGYSRIRGESHPATLTVANTFGVLECLDGEVADARTRLEQTFTALEATLPESHPYVWIGRMNLASALFQAGEVQAAREADTVSLARLRERLHSRSHPAILTAGVNLVASRLAAGDRTGGEAQREEVLRIAGELFDEKHPLMVALRSGGRAFFDLEPLST